MTICLYSCYTEDYDRLIILLLGSDSFWTEADNFSYNLDFFRNYQISLINLN